MDHNSLSQEEPGCSHGPKTINKINNTEAKHEDEFIPQVLVTSVLRLQTETTLSKEIAFCDINNYTEKCTKGTDKLLSKYTSEEHLELNNNESSTSKEVAVHEPQIESTTLIKTNENDTASIKIELPTCITDNSVKAPKQHPNFPLILISRPPSFTVDNKPVDPITLQPQRQLQVMMPTPNTPSSLHPKIPNLNSETSTNAAVPPSLFIQALSKINQSNLSLTLLNQLQDIVKNSYDAGNRNVLITEPEISAPSSVTESAPPSYSFVLRQNSRRPQLMGTFIPSPSFVPLTPPPNYAAAFDIYVDNGMPPPRPRAINYGFTPMPVVCPICGVAGISVTHSKITLCTHLCAVLMCLFCCWLCVPLPYLLNSCKDVYHYCGNCRNFLGMYCPTNPEPTSSFA